jgi:signal transduction histidine kinase
MIIYAIAVIFIALALFIILFSFFFNQKKNKLIKEKIIMQAKFQQELLQTQIEIQEQTLKTISQEIHDNVGQVLSLAKLQLSTFPVSDDVQSVKINTTKELVSKAINDLRNLSRSMYGNQFENGGLETAIRNELAIVESSGQYRTRFSRTGEAYKLEQRKEMVVFRMLQESINNIIKHARAGSIEINLDYQPGHFSFQIEDDGKGFNAFELNEHPHGMGLASMQHRATLIGGKLNIDTAENKGTRISFELDLASKI